MFFDAHITLLILAFIGLLATTAPWRRQWRRGKHVEIGKVGVDVNIYRGKGNSLNGASISIDLPGGLDFSLRLETFLDRFAKYVGLAREWETGDATFDQRIYITCDDPLLQSALSSDAALHQTLSRVLATDGRSIYCAHGRLWLECGSEGEARTLSDAFLRERFARTFGDDLQLLRERLLPLAGRELESARDPTIAARTLMAIIASICAVLGIVGGIYDIFLDDQQVVRENIVRISNWTVAFAALALLTAYALRLHGTSSAQRALVDILLAALPGVWLAAGGSLTWYNEHRDTSPPALYSVRVDRVYKSEKKNGWDYYLVVAGWPDARGERKVEIDQAVFDAVRAGGCVDVIWRRGKFGDGWVSGYQQNTTNVCEGTFVE
ncbi:MAG TPA: hypothetical protein VK624_19445 [Steroidobacteraceae bacterium]|nr:hypothetical protein [Steroidobacteraceae bacterium]